MLALDSVPSYDRETDASLAISCKLISISIASIAEFGFFQSYFTHEDTSNKHATLLSKLSWLSFTPRLAESRNKNRTLYHHLKSS